MYEAHGRVKLRDGDEVELGVIRGPDAEWADRLCELLGHKGDPWNWQNRRVLTDDLSIETYYHVLHRDGAPFANIFSGEFKGVGVFGHVWTRPEDRKKGAAALLMRHHAQRFRERDGKALFLGTGYDSPAYHIYRKEGFESIEPGSGMMWCFATSWAQFCEEYFADGPTTIVDVDWRHWPAGAPLTIGEFPGVVRGVPLGIIGRCSTEDLLLPAVRAAESPGYPNQPPRAVALQLEETGAVAGLASWNRDPTWPGAAVADVYCHPRFWPHAPELLDRLTVPEDINRVIAYADAGNVNPIKKQVLHGAGFRTIATLPRWAPADTQAASFVDVVLMQRS